MTDDPQEPPPLIGQEPPLTGGALDPDEVRYRASAGMFIVATRGVAILLLGLLGSVIFARLLTPQDFGIVAIGAAFVTFVALLSDGGLGAGLIRREDPPLPSELRALTGLQLAMTCGVALVVTIAALPFGDPGRVVAVMVWSMPVVALQFPGRILLERELRYKPLALVEVSQVLAYNLVGISLVLLGAGVWGLVLGTVVRAVVGSVAMNLVCPAGRGWPRFSWGSIKPLMAFGLRLQAVSATWLIRDQGLSAAIAVVGGVTTLGLTSLVRRLLEVPYLLLNSLWRVSFPALSQLMAAKQNPTRSMERAVAIASVGTGLILVGLVGSAPGLIPGLFGAPWTDAKYALPGSCLGLGISGSVSIATQGYLYAVENPSAVLRSAVWQTVVVFVVTLALLPLIGLWAVGLGALASALVETAVLVHATRTTLDVRLWQPLVAPVVVGCVAGACGWALAERGGADLLSGLLGGLLSAAVFAGGLLLVRRSLVIESASFVRRAVRAALSHEPG